MTEEWLAIRTDAIKDVLAEGIKPLCDRIQELEAENTRLREEWAQEGIGWLRDKDIDRLMAVEDENKRLRERLEDNTASLRVEIAAKRGAYNEIKILEADNALMKKALREIEEGICLVFDEGEEREVEVWMDSEDLQEIARKALAEVDASGGGGR